MTVISLSQKKNLFQLLLLLFSACAGFAIVSYIMLDDSGKKIKADAKERIKKQAGVNATIPVSVPVHVPAPAPAPAATASSSIPGRDVFREFYLKRSLWSGSTKVRKGTERMLEKNMPDLTKFLNSGENAKPLPPVQVSRNAPVSGEDIIDVKILGVACIGNDDCAAITSLGVLRKGDKIVSETVSGISEDSITTDKRKVAFN